MPLRFEKSDNGLIVFLSGEIDHHSAAPLRECIDNAVKIIKPTRLVLDFGDITFMDSSGVGLVMGRYKLVSYFGGSIEIRNLSERLEKIFRLSGIEKIANIETGGKAV